MIKYERSNHNHPINQSLHSFLYNFYLLSGMHLQRAEPQSLPLHKASSLSAWIEEELGHLSHSEDKNEDIFFKSQVSLAETCEEETPRNSSFSQDILDEDNLSFDSLNLHQSLIEGEICQDFVLNGSCMKGEGCELGHHSISDRQEKRRTRVRMWLWEEMPQLALSGFRRANSFLG